MATSPKTAQNKHHAAFPTLFKRSGEARRLKGFRASRETFTRAMRLAKVLDNAPRLMIMTQVGAMVLSEQATEILKEDGGVAALLLNGFEILIPMGSVEPLIGAHDAFLVSRNMLDITTSDMFEEGEE